MVNPDTPKVNNLNETKKSINANDKPMVKKSSLKEQKKKDGPCFFKDSKVDKDHKRKLAKQIDPDKNTTPHSKKGIIEKLPFEMNGHKFFLTYSGLTDEEASKERMLAFIK